jgi:hypothetical protein
MNILHKIEHFLGINLLVPYNYIVGSDIWTCDRCMGCQKDFNQFKLMSLKEHQLLYANSKLFPKNISHQ